MARLSAEGAKCAFDEVTHKVALEKGMRALLHFSDGKILGFMQMNRNGQMVLSKTLPELFKHIGMDVAEHLCFILN
jgi:hypothetical protein